MHRKGMILSSQSGLIKCKDFFNDVVAWKNAKKAFSIYRFDNQVSFNREGLYFHLTGIGDVTKFFINLNVVNTRLYKDMGVIVSVHTHALPEGTQPNTSVVISIPNKVWKSTYYISVLSLLIRVCNYNCTYQNWEEIFADTSPMKTIDGAFLTKTRNYVCKNGFKLPVTLRKLWYKSMKGFNSKDAPQTTCSVIHNNGANDWVNNMEVM
ncbi:MAG: hypothetical protein KGI54_10590 [Pseudomonadota bacterium]|nr:hypothetical protein [Pseudomonadota bacterium]